MSTIYEMKHDSIEFSSLNPKQVEHYEKILSGISKEDIQLNNVVGRHNLLLNMGLAGHSPLTEDYFYYRGVKYDMIEAKLSNTRIPWNSCKSTVREQIEEEVDKIILNKYNWNLSN
jgi:hypothetical protein